MYPAGAGLEPPNYPNNNSNHPKSGSKRRRLWSRKHKDKLFVVDEEASMRQEQIRAIRFVIRVIRQFHLGRLAQSGETHLRRV
jgi:hypothetical protein